MLNQALRLIRVFHDHNQRELAKKLNISPSYLSEIESGSKSVTMDLLKKYGEIFSVPPSSLMLFSEQLESKTFPERTRVVFAKKIVKMLEWIATKESPANGESEQEKN